MLRRLCLLVLFALIASSLTPTTVAIGWEQVDQILKDGLTSRTTPGLQALVADSTGILYHKTFGAFTYGEPTPINGNNPPVLFSTIYDMASLTKVLATTTTAMLLYDRGLLDLDMKIAHPKLLGPDFAVNGKGDISVRNLLLHNSGFAPDPIPGYGDKPFGCPETLKYYPQLSFNCMPKIYQNMLQEKLKNPVGAVAVYSDLSMIVAALAFGRIAKENLYIPAEDLPADCMRELQGPPQWTCYFYGFVNHYIVKGLRLARSGFLLDKSLYAEAVPAWNDTTYRHILIQGVVSDENAYASGGYAGHAGYWSTSSDTYQLVRTLLFPSHFAFVKPSTVELFTKAGNLSQSSRALGWDTNDYKMNPGNACGSLSPKTFTHLGYTGTQVCNDPERGLMTILLTNRVYPGKTGTADLIAALRKGFNTAVQKVYDARAFTAEIEESAPFK